MKFFGLAILLYCHFGQAQPWPKSVDTAAQLPRQVRNFFKAEITLVSENDNYTLQLRDGYYTNGLMLQYSRAHLPKQEGKRLRKWVESFEIGQHIYNPVRFDSVNLATQDRPFAGYLYLRYEQRRFYTPRSMWQYSASLGTIGKASFASNVQGWYHGVISIYPVTGWPNQLKDEVSLNMAARHAVSLLRGNPGQRWADVTLVSQAALGNAYTGAQAGLLLRLGRPEEYDRSLHWGSRTAAHAAQGPRHPSELYFFMHPSLHYQLYNATLQGGLFRHDKGPKTVPIEPLYVSNQIGFGYAQNRWTLMMYLVTRGRMAKTQLRTERFISIKLSYRFAEGGKTSHTTH